MRTLIAMVKKELLQLKADKFYLRFLIFAPLLQLIVLGHALTTETTNVPTLIADLDRTAVSREFVRAVSTNERFNVIGHVTDYASLTDAIQRWEASVGIYIPPGYTSDLECDGSTELLVLLDSVDGNKALSAYGYLQQIAVREGKILAPVPAVIQSSDRPILNYRYLFNPELKNSAYMVPGIVVVIVTIITLMIGAMSLVREKEVGTLEQLMVTPINRAQLILGKLIPFLLYAFIEVTVILKVAGFVFGLSLAGSLATLYLALFLYLFSTLGLGLLVSSIAATQQQALFLAWFFMIFMILLSGFLIPVANMPGWLQTLTLANPLRFMMTTVREIYLKATPLSLLADQLIPLSLLGGAIFSISVLTFRKHSG
ncbi:ABC transporter permease [Marispirochaeta sp.]|uniref:ABC transporter permease n=1 Tax=Marispirochaeta sp. TaxID=2038653 RepID=UPI0029C8F435|nr:ABC transporter permease [Marispirochaeta sp.]